MPDDASDPFPDRPARRLPEGLVLVSTPIGNLADLSARGLALLRAADLVLAEDTRNTRHLARTFAITAPLSPLHEHNEERRIPELLALLAAGRRIALVSDAGTPLISDPGFRLVRSALAAGLPVHAIPGPNAALMALTLSGLPPQPFLFLGFPAPRAAARRAAFGRIAALEAAGLSATLIWHEAPHRLAATLADLASLFGPRPAAVARELTKLFEEVRRDTLTELAAHYGSEAPRGEITVVVAPPAQRAPALPALEARLASLLAGGTRLSEAVAVLTRETGLPRRTIYRAALDVRRGLPDAPGKA